MNGERFTLDTNVLVYATDSLAGGKRERALSIILRAAERDCPLTLQVLGEFFAAATRKGIVSWGTAEAQVQDWMTMFAIVTADRAALRAALAMSRTRRVGFWDALLLATAREAGCAVLLSEDLQDGASYAGVRVRNPFKGAAIPAAVGRLLGLG